MSARSPVHAVGAGPGDEGGGADTGEGRSGYRGQQRHAALLQLSLQVGTALFQLSLQLGIDHLTIPAVPAGQ